MKRSLVYKAVKSHEESLLKLAKTKLAHVPIFALPKQVLKPKPDKPKA